MEEKCVSSRNNQKVISEGNYNAALEVLSESLLHNLKTGGL